MLVDPEELLILIPARAGSKRVPGKNLRPLAGQSLVERAVALAHATQLGWKIVVSSDSREILAAAERAGAEPLERPAKYAQDDSPDILWVKHALFQYPEPEAFMILRPTSPFLKAETLRKAWDRFTQYRHAQSMRAVRLACEHPGKMWVIRSGRLFPLLPTWFRRGEVPWHDMPTQALMPVYVQTSGFEIAWSETVWRTHSISGTHVIPYVLTGEEAFAIDTEADWAVAEARLAHSSRPVAK